MLSRYLNIILKLLLFSLLSSQFLFFFLLVYSTTTTATTTLNCNSVTSYCNGDWNFCSSSYPCGELEGDCDQSSECNAGLICGADNCPSDLGFDSAVDCCIPQSTTINPSKFTLLGCQSCMPIVF